MMKKKFMEVPAEFDDMLNRSLDNLIKDCEILGIKKNKIPKAKAIRLLTKKIYEQEQKDRKMFIGLL